MQIIALISQKGGAGKTTLAVADERAGFTSALNELFEWIHGVMTLGEV